MLKKFLHFIKYNNAMTFLVLFVFLFASGVFASTDVGQEMIGQQAVTIEGGDNSLLLELDLEEFDMNFQIEKIEQDKKYYYVVYTYLDLLELSQVWQYQVKEKIKKVPLSIREDLGDYLAEEFKEEYEYRLKYLQEKKDSAEMIGRERRIEVVEYGGLIGRVLHIRESVFSGYEAVKKNELASPAKDALLVFSQKDIQENVTASDNLVSVYDDYMEKIDRDDDDVFSEFDNCPNDYNPDQADSDNDGIGDICDEVDNSNNDTDTTDTVATNTEEDLSGDTEDNPGEGAETDEGSDNDRGEEVGQATDDQAVDDSTDEEGAATDGASSDGDDVDTGDEVGDAGEEESVVEEPVEETTTEETVSEEVLEE